MTDPDVVAELDAWLKGITFWRTNASEMIDPKIAERARDEIVALRKSIHPAIDAIRDAARAEALEEAARMFETHDMSLLMPRMMADAIRALKEKP